MTLRRRTANKWPTHKAKARRRRAWRAHCRKRAAR
jgi:hypothetical protein